MKGSPTFALSVKHRQLVDNLGLAIW